MSHLPTSESSSWLFPDKLDISPEWREILQAKGWSSVSDLMSISAGTDVSRASKQAVQKIEFTHKKSDHCFYLKQKRIQTFKQLVKTLRRPNTLLLASTREYLILKLCRKHGIAVMPTVACGERRFLFWPIGGFILVDSVAGTEFHEALASASPALQRRMMFCYGSLVGTLHRLQINSKVRPRDMICKNMDFNSYRDSIVLIDRERGKIQLTTMDERKALKQIVDVWQKNAQFLNYPSYRQLLAYLSGYCHERPEYKTLLRDKKHVIKETLAKLALQSDSTQFNQNYEPWLTQS